MNLYLVNEGEKAVLSGALIMAALFDIQNNIPFVKKSAYGAYNSLMGLNFNMIISSKMPEIKPYMNPKRYAELENRLKKARFDLMSMDATVISYALGFDSPLDYYDYVETKGRLNRIKVPTFIFQALDDPVIKKELNPFKEVEDCENVILGVTN